MTERKGPEPEIGDDRFDLDAYLMQRSSDPNFVMFEIGHSSVPAALHQEFKGRRAYIGIESWQRKHSNVAKMWPQTETKLAPRREEENIFFQEHDPDFRSTDAVERDDYDAIRGFYNPEKMETIFPAGAADEIFLNNVFGDPHVGKGQNGELLLREVVRLLDDQGKIVIRESQSPANAITTDIDPRVLQGFGLKIDIQIYKSSDVKRWEELEELYAKDDPSPPRPGEYYMILSKK